MTRLEDVLIAPSGLTAFGPGGSVADQAHALLLQQRAEFALARDGYASLGRVQVRQFDFDGFAVQLQCNPARMRSSAARVDAHSVGARPCFLCVANLPAGQRGLRYGDDYLILANPYPVAPEHLTIPALIHTPQRLRGALGTLLSLACDLSPRYTIVYNGPQCGASAPDHLHFQAVPAGFLPLDRDFEQLAARHGTHVRPAAGPDAGDGPQVRATVFATLACRCVALEGDDPEALADSVGRLLAVLVDLVPGDGEPMVNLIVRYYGSWRVVVVPRTRHRPSTYPTGDGEGILLSPASVDLGGVCITPRAQDFQRLQPEQLLAIFAEVGLGREAMLQLSGHLAMAL